MLKLTFNLKVDRAELGAILKEFDPNIESTLIPASEFLRYFLRLGIDARDKARMEQRQRQLELNALAESASTKKLTQAEAKMNLEVDYNFSQAAEESAQEKLKTAAAKYDRYATGAVALDGFECESLDPGAFKDLLRRVFNITLTSGELGYVVKRYDVKTTGKVLCKPFLTDFLRMGQEIRYKGHVEQLERQRSMIEITHENHQKKIAAVQNSESLRISSNFGDRHLKSALAMLTEAATRYDKVRGVSLISFEPSHLSPLEFQKALKRTFNIKFTPQEMGAAVDYFDKDGSKTVYMQLKTIYSLCSSVYFPLIHDQSPIFCGSGALPNIFKHLHHPWCQQEGGGALSATQAAARRLGEAGAGSREKERDALQQDPVQRRL